MTRQTFLIISVLVFSLSFFVFEQSPKAEQKQPAHIYTKKQKIRTFDNEPECGYIYPGCPQGLYCGGGSCQPPSLRGENCGYPNHAPCLSGFYCIRNVCRDAGGNGDYCGQPTHPPCKSGYFCVFGQCTTNPVGAYFDFFNGAKR